MTDEDSQGRRDRLADVVDDVKACGVGAPRNGKNRRTNAQLRSEDLVGRKEDKRGADEHEDHTPRSPGITRSPRRCAYRNVVHQENWRDCQCSMKRQLHNVSSTQTNDKVEFVVGSAAA